MGRLQDLLAPPGAAQVAVVAEHRAPRSKAWTLQVFSGMGDPASTQHSALARSAWARWTHRGAAPRPLGHASQRRKRGRHHAVNAYGPRWADLLGGLLRDTEVLRHGHLPLNELGDVRHDPDGPVAIFMPVGARGLRAAVPDVVRLAAKLPVLVHIDSRCPHRAAAPVRRRLAPVAGVTFAGPGSDPFPLLEGSRAVLAAPGSLALEAHCMGLPAALILTPGAKAAGFEAELAGPAGHAHAFHAGDRGMDAWAEAPGPPSGLQWARDLLFDPRRNRNDALAADLRKRAVEAALR